MRASILIFVLAGCDVGTGGPTAGSSADAGARDAPSGGAVDATAGGDASGTAITCATPGLLFCEDFEAAPLGAVTSTAKWTVDTQSGSLAIDAVHARGTRALHVHTDGNGRALLRVAGFAPSGNSFYGRARVWATAFPTAPDYAHFTLVEAAGQSGGVVRPIGGQYIPASAGAGAGRSLWGVGADGGATGDWTRWQTTAPAEAGRWLCFEWQLDASDASVHVWIDGAARPELAVSRTDHGGANVDFTFPTFTQLWFGWWLYQGGPTPSSYDLWYDDLALGSSRLGC